MALDSRLRDCKYRNWVKATLGLKHLKQGLTSFVTDQAALIHATFIASIEQKCNITNVQCSTCQFKTILPAHVSNMTRCPLRGRCCCFKGNKIPCSKGICDEMYDTIVSEHNLNNPIWNSTDSLKWTSSPWELAKCYLSSSGYKDKQTADECDASGLLSICINSKTIRSIITDISQFEQARAARNEILHSSSFELEDTTLVDHIGVMLAVLNDPNIHPNHDAAGAVTNLQQLLTDNAVIDNAAESQAREMALVEINARIIEVQKEVTALTALDTERKEELERIEQDLVMTRNKHKDDLKSLTQTIQILYSRDDATNIRVDDLWTRQHISEKHHTETKERQDALEKHHAETTERLDATDAQLCTNDQRLTALEEHKDKKQKKFGLPRKFAYKVFNYDGGLQRYLVDTYKQYYLKSDVSPIFPEVEHIDNLFIPIMLSWTLKGRHKRIKKEIRKLKELFQSDGHGGQIMFIAADAGMGKTTICRKIISTWCKAYDEDFRKTLSGNIEAQKFIAEEESWRKTEQENVRFMKRFKYLFFVYLRDAHSESSIEEMVENNLLENSHPEIFRHIIKNESDRCLFILDGLDEWKLDNIHDAKSHGRSRDIPFNNNTCTILYTTRPWKLAERLIQDNESTIELEGLTTESSKWLVYKMIEKLKEREYKPLEDTDFLSELQTKNLGHFQTIPIMVKLLVCLWFDNQELSDKVTVIYCDVLKLIMNVFTNRTNDRQTASGSDQTHVRLPSLLESSECALYADVILALGKFSHQMHRGADPLVFTRDQLKHQGMTQEQIQVCLDSGLLSKTALKQAASCRHLQISYIHKTFQEFFVALHMATTTGYLTDLLKTITTRNAVAEQSVILPFVCGLDNDGVKQIAEHIYSCSSITRDTSNRRELQTLVFSLIRETQHVEKNSIPLNDIHIDEHNVDDEQLVTEWIDPIRLNTLSCKDIAFTEHSMYMRMTEMERISLLNCSFNGQFQSLLLALQCGGTLKDLELELSSDTTFSHSQITAVLCLPMLGKIQLSGLQCRPDGECGCETTNHAKANCISNRKNMKKMNAKSCRIQNSREVLNHILEAPNIETLILEDTEVDQEHLTYFIRSCANVRYVTLCQAELPLNRLQLSVECRNITLVLLADVTIGGGALKSLIESIPSDNPKMLLIFCRVLIDHNSNILQTWAVTPDRSGFIRFHQILINQNNGLGEVDVRTLAGQIYGCPVSVTDSKYDRTVQQTIFSYIKESQQPTELSSVPLNDVIISREDDLNMIKYVDPPTVKTLVLNKVSLSAAETCLKMNTLEKLKVTNCGFSDQFTPTVLCTMVQYCAHALTQLIIIHANRDTHLSHSQATSLLCLPVLSDITMSGVKCERDSNCGCESQGQAHGDETRINDARAMVVKHCKLENTRQVLCHVLDAPEMKILILNNCNESPPCLHRFIKMCKNIQYVYIDHSPIGEMQLSPQIQSLRVLKLYGVRIRAAALKSLTQSVPGDHPAVMIKLLAVTVDKDKDSAWLLAQWGVESGYVGDAVIIVNKDISHKSRIVTLSRGMKVTSCVYKVERQYILAWDIYSADDLDVPGLGEYEHLLADLPGFLPVSTSIPCQRLATFQHETVAGDIESVDHMKHCQNMNIPRGHCIYMYINIASEVDGIPLETIRPQAKTRLLELESYIRSVMKYLDEAKQRSERNGRDTFELTVLFSPNVDRPCPRYRVTWKWD